MLSPENVKLLYNTIEFYQDDSQFERIVMELESSSIYFNIEDYRSLIRTHGYVSIINMVDQIISKLVSLNDTELLSKMIWLKRVLIKQNKESIMYVLFSYDLDEIVLKADEIKEQIDHAFYRLLNENDYIMSCDIACNSYANMCNSLTIQELKSIPNMIDSLFLALHFGEDFQTQKNIILKWAISAYNRVLNECKSVVIKNKKAQIRLRLREEQAYSKMYPDDIEGQYVIDEAKPYIDEAVKLEINKMAIENHKKVLKKNINDEYKQLDFFDLLNETNE